MKPIKITAGILFLMILFTSCQKGPANLRLPSVIGDNMVLQQKSDVQIWGMAIPGRKVSVSASWGTKKVARTGKEGKWAVTLKTPPAGGPYKIEINAADTSIKINNVLVGEVWVCSGQSNMEMPLEGWPPKDTIMNSAKTIASAKLPDIRLFIVSRKISSDLQDDCVGKWEVCNPMTVRPFSATGFFFGKKLYEKLNIPVGLIESTWGGTPVEAWMPADVLENAGEFVTDIKNIKESKPQLAEYQAFLDKHRKVEARLTGNDRWKNIGLGDEDAASPDFNDKLWPVMKLPALFETVIGDFDGVVWFRKTITLPAGFKGKELVLSLGPIDDMDCTWVNGKLVGATEESGLYQFERNYNIPAGLMHEGTNTVAIRVLDTGGGGGIYGKPGSMYISVKKGKQPPVDIGGDWKYQPSAELIGNKFYLFDITKNEFPQIKRPRAITSNSPAVLFNGMINPLINYCIKGAIWYQGEANVGRANQYSKIFPLMIQSWRDAWKIKDFPFYFVQIAPYVYAGEDSTESVLLREAQKNSLKTPKTGMALTLDIATVMNIHPPFKEEVGNRLASLALNNDYGINTPCHGPAYKSMVINGNVVKIQFENTGSGLVSKNEFIPEFEIAGTDGGYVKAVAKIVKNEVWISSPKITKPTAVRYCWRNGAIGALFNSDGLPAEEFSEGK